MMLRLKSIVIVCLCLSLNACVFSRLGRPEISGTVLDYNGAPIKNVKVGESSTNELGNFTLEERRYREFVLIWIPEAPPLFVSENISKAGYESDAIKYSNPHGGSGRRGAKFNVGNIYLKKIGLQHDLKAILKGDWLIATTPKFDILYLVHEDQYNMCLTMRCKNLIQNYVKYSHDRWGEGNLPKNVTRRTTKISFNEDTFSLNEVQVVKEAVNNFVSLSSDHAGTWRTENNRHVEFTAASHWLNGLYKIDTFSKTHMQLSRISCEQNESLKC